MSIQALYAAATGMTAMETKLDVTANNLANMETTGFKKGRCNFEDLLYRHLQYPGAIDPAGQLTATGTSVGLGTRVASIQANMETGAFENSNRELDVAISGEGLLRVVEPGSGEFRYTRAGNLSVNRDGQLVAGSAQIGRLIDPPITIPDDATHITISADGRVQVEQPGSNGVQEVGQIGMSRFQNPEGLLRMGENLFMETDASGAPIDGLPAQDGFGQLMQNFLETSNVEPVQEIISLITTQRAFELNSQVVSTGDQVLQTVTNMKRT